MTSRKTKILAYDRPVPRYTSYPPATYFEPVSSGEWRQALASVPPHSKISLYVHIPFCAKLCYYCGCFTSVTKKPERIERYLNLLQEEAKRVAGAMLSGSRVAHLHFGGGSPILLSPDQFAALMACLRACFSFASDVQIAIEADPRQLSEAKIAAYVRAGINRISFGVQDFNPRVLQAVNREQPVALTAQAVGWCLDYGLANINFDLMYGLPHQTIETIRQTMEIATAISPSRIAFFGYAHVPWMKKHMRAVDMEAMPQASERYDLFAAGHRILTKEGYEMVGIDHFVRPGDDMLAAARAHRLHRNFQGYTTDAATYLIGLGASAISETPEGYMQNQADIAAYETAVEEGRLPTARGRRKMPIDVLCGKIIEELMSYHEVNLAPFTDDARMAAILPLAHERLQPLVNDGLVGWEGNHVRVLPQAPMVTRLVASAFDQYTPWPQEGEQAMLRHATAI